MIRDYVLASKFLIQEPDVQDFVRNYAAVINDKYAPIWNEIFDIGLVFGGRGGGKSEAVCQNYIKRSRTEDYFKCYYGRKIFDTVRGSCFETLVHNMEEMRVNNEYSFSVANTSSMIIRHKDTGNSFMPFGADKAEKLKSIKDPTDIWGEEFDQFTFEDFKEIYPTLRTSRGANRFTGTFNTHKVFSDHWLMKYFFPELYTGEDKQEFDILENVNVLKLFINYTDNYFIDQEKYFNTLKMASGGNSLILEAIANGAWGVVENDSPWMYAFDVNKHIRSVQFMPQFPVYVFIDVNNDPLECTLWQMSPNKGTKNSFIHCIDEFSGKYKVTELGQQIKAKYPASILFLGGDRSGQNEDVGRNQTIYQILAGAMGLSDRQLLLNSHNLEHADSRMLCNSMFHNYPNLYINAEKCPNLVRQIQMAKVDVKSVTPSKLLKDRGMYKNDALDSMRYFFQTMFNDFAKNTYFKVLNKR